MLEAAREKSDGMEMGLLLGGVLVVLVAYFLPAVTFFGPGGPRFGLSLFSKLPIMSLIAFGALAAAVATRFVPSLARYAEQATIIAILLVLAPALLGFMMALDPWTGIYSAFCRRDDDGVFAASALAPRRNRVIWKVVPGGEHCAARTPF